MDNAQYMLIQEAVAYCQKQAAYYTSWGNVDILQMAFRQQNNSFFYTKENAILSSLNHNEIIQNGEKHPIFSPIFTSNKHINCIFITRQKYASQIKNEIPPILDDQAQLLGVTVRIAKNENSLTQALKNRFATILPDGNSVCVGATYEDTFVAAQLLEKTSKAYIEAQYVGGAKSINKIEAWLMQKFYQWKYAKMAGKK